MNVVKSNTPKASSVRYDTSTQQQESPYDLITITTTITMTPEQRKITSDASIFNLRDDQTIANTFKAFALTQIGILNAEAGILRTQGFTEAASRANAAAVNANFMAQAAASYKSAVDAEINVTERWGLAFVVVPSSDLTAELNAAVSATLQALNYVNLEIGAYNINCGLFKTAKEKALVSTPGTPVTPGISVTPVTLGGAFTAEQIAINKQTAEQERINLGISESIVSEIHRDMVSYSADLKTHGNLLRAWDFVPAAQSHEWAAESANLAAEMASNLLQSIVTTSTAWVNWGNSTNQEMAASKKAILDNAKASATNAELTREQQFFGTAMAAANTERGKLVIIMKNQNAQQSTILSSNTQVVNEMSRTIGLETASMRTSGFAEAQAAYEAAAEGTMVWLVTSEKTKSALASDLNSLVAYGNSQTVKTTMEQGAKVQEARSALRNELSGLEVLFASLQAKLASAVSAKNKAVATKAAADAAAAKVLADGNQSNTALQEEARQAAERARVAREAAAASAAAAEAARVAAKTASEAAAAEAARVAAKTASEAAAAEAARVAAKTASDAAAKAVPAEDEAAKKKAQKLKERIKTIKYICYSMTACGIFIIFIGLYLMFGIKGPDAGKFKILGGFVLFASIVLIVFSTVYLANGGGIQKKL
jgi:hypothetical protein